jgi:hypothetical protein
MMPLNLGNRRREFVLTDIVLLHLNRWSPFNSNSVFSRALYHASISTMTSSRHVILHWRSQRNPPLLPAVTLLWFGSMVEDS